MPCIQPVAQLQDRSTLLCMRFCRPCDCPLHRFDQLVRLCVGINTTSSIHRHGRGLNALAENGNLAPQHSL